MTADKKDGAPKKPGLLEKLSENDRYRKIIIAAGLVGIALIFLSGLLGKSGAAQSTAQSASSQQGTSAQDYETRLEQELTDIISGIKGAGKTKVLVTLEQTEETVYAVEEKSDANTTQENNGSSETKKDTSSSSEKTYLIVKDADGAENPLTVTVKQPVVKGVVVVCDGAGSPAVQQDIIDAVTTALDITSVRVCVLKAESIG